MQFITFATALFASAALATPVDPPGGPNYNANSNVVPPPGGPKYNPNSNVVPPPGGPSYKPKTDLVPPPGPPKYKPASDLVPPPGGPVIPDNTHFYPPPDFVPYPYPGVTPGHGGDANGPYFGSCSCAVFGQQSDLVGEGACKTLAQDWPNLWWNGQGCVDSLQAGIEKNGFGEACKAFAKPLLDWPFSLLGFPDLDSCVQAVCTPY
ncbi:uncharacterized protein SEPMUDRAFT_108175 [Sphaerulina musiva SO2202]|uniref:Uncharacterized protein n=1 Tax=Sphaerulina musiva (strain SO2202) TaxID=692275 RepID=M3CFW2_SPHMS|nr:uncharacterized protein SEPMUDRAFT_108175 [Sphaerulina musiva SO2202]EMF12698.1 hypothetical protein SEPMUDRAFT_108175 [Sphaerulina musiva SO2202]